MLTGDYIAIGVLGFFALLGVMGWLRWLVHAAIGVAVGCLILVVLSRAHSVPALGRAGALLNDGHITPALTRQVDIVVDNLRPDPPLPDADTQEPEPDDADPTDADTGAQTDAQAAAQSPTISPKLRAWLADW